MTGNNNHAITDDAPMTLKEACSTLLRNTVKPATLRAAAGRGELVLERLGKRDVVTPQAIREWRQKCRDKRKAYASGRGQPAETETDESPTKPSTLSKTEQISSAQAAAWTIVEALKKPSANTSPRSTNLRGGATVIPIAPRSQT